MLRLSSRAVHGQGAKTLVLVIVALLAALVLRDWIIEGTFDSLNLRVLGAALVVVAVFILGNWRRGLFLFLFWLVIEDLPRKYLGNNMFMFFGKDILALIVYLAFSLALLERRTRSFRPPFLVPLLIFAGVGLIQVFNPQSPSLLYGALGIKLYFYYAPLMFVGYALVQTERDLSQFLQFNVLLGAIVAVLGVIQGVVGFSFMNPEELAPELRGLGQLTRYAPESKQALIRPTSVFVSDSRFAWYILLIFILSIGLAGYQIFRAIPWRKLTFLVLGVTGVALVISGVRGCFVYGTGSLVVLLVAMLWGSPHRGPGHVRFATMIRRSAVMLSLAVAAMAVVFPEEIGARWNFYYETMAFSSPHSELVSRVRDYPLDNLMVALEFPNWPVGYGIGTASLGVQYVNRVLGGVRPPVFAVENGYGSLLLEMGIPGLLTWIFWTTAALVAGWRVVKRLKGTHLFPVGFSIFWFAFVLLFPMTYGGLFAYQNYVLNAYLWLLLGVLFRLPALLEVGNLRFARAEGNATTTAGHQPEANGR